MLGVDGRMGGWVVRRRWENPQGGQSTLGNMYSTVAPPYRCTVVFLRAGRRDATRQ